jgi:hypothetical protein
VPERTSNNYPQPEYQKIDNALAYVHKDIPISPELQMELFEQVFPETETPRLDYINLASDEFNQDTESPETQKVIEAKFLQSKSLFSKIKMSLLGMSPKDKEALNSYVNSYKQMIKYANESRKHIHYEHSDRQLSDFKEDESLVLQRRDTLVFKKFRETIKSNPKKPFLILFGHGGQSWSLNKGLPTKKWSIGEASTGNTIDLQKLFSHLDLEKYSAVLLVSCNDGKAQPPRIENVPLFYVDGIAGRLTKNQPKVRE